MGVHTRFLIHSLVPVFIHSFQLDVCITKFFTLVMSNQASNTQTGAQAPPAPQGAPPQMMMGAPQPQYAPQRQAMVVTSGGGEPYCGPTTIMMGVVLCCFTGCGFWVALCPMDRRPASTTIVE